MKRKSAVLTIAGGVMLALAVVSNAALGQVTFQPPGCEFRVWFVVEPKVTKAKVPTASGPVETTIAELNPILDDNRAHYFRAECTLVALEKVDLADNMRQIAEANRLRDAKVWVEEDQSSGLAIGRLRATISTGQRTYYMDIRRYVSENALFDVWAGAEAFPTEGIIMFFRSVAYQGKSIH